MPENWSLDYLGKKCACSVHFATNTPGLAQAAAKRHGTLSVAIGFTSLNGKGKVFTWPPFKDDHHHSPKVSHNKQFKERNKCYSCIISENHLKSTLIWKSQLKKPKKWNQWLSMTILCIKCISKNFKSYIYGYIQYITHDIYSDSLLPNIVI